MDGADAGGHREGKQPAAGGDAEGSPAAGSGALAATGAVLLQGDSLKSLGVTEGDLLVMGAQSASEAAEAAAEAAAAGIGNNGMWVSALTYCPHVLSADADAALLPPHSVPPFDSLCHSCKDGSENWVCLTCGVVACGRYVGGHMLQHVTETAHPLAAGFRDLSVWCFHCDSYLDAIRIPALEPLFTALHLAKFGQPPAKPPS
ncbi:unnamed protein product [Closterium sp. NIES-64]|nr:unnamed protein product [Closterium sp. NIES-64]CAI5981123.1 unnamed protein product [Closterium sp. NIES-65]